MPQSLEKRHEESDRRKEPEASDDLALDLPALDGEGEEASDEAFALDDDGEGAHGDPFDDATGESVPHDDLAVEGAETGWLDGAETAGGLDLGPLDVAFEPEGKEIADEEEDRRPGMLDDLVPSDEMASLADGGEEGPLAADEELREDELPALDADEEGDVPDEDLFDRALIAVDDELRWDDRAWTHAMADAAGVDDADDSGILAIPSDDAQSLRDAAWRRLEESGHAMAAAFVPGDGVVVALSTPDRSRALLVRIQPDGEARIIAEVDPRGHAASARQPSPSRRASGEDEGERCVVTFLRWDEARGCLFVGGTFGVEAYRPA
jgi:hypothetical protein